MNHKITIEIPRSLLTDEQIENLKKIISNQAADIKSKFGTDNTDIIVSDENIAFPWFEFSNDENRSLEYIYYITTLCDRAKSE